MSSSSESNTRRKRSWSRAVFSSLQRKGLERRFSLQKYITKPDRRQLAATLGLTDAQVVRLGQFCEQFSVLYEANGSSAIDCNANVSKRDPVDEKGVTFGVSSGQGLVSKPPDEVATYARKRERRIGWPGLHAEGLPCEGGETRRQRGDAARGRGGRGDRRGPVKRLRLGRSWAIPRSRCIQ